MVNHTLTDNSHINNQTNLKSHVVALKTLEMVLIHQRDHLFINPLLWHIRVNTPNTGAPRSCSVCFDTRVLRPEAWLQGEEPPHRMRAVTYALNIGRYVHIPHLLLPNIGVLSAQKTQYWTGSGSNGSTSMTVLMVPPVRQY